MSASVKHVCDNDKCGEIIQPTKPSFLMNLEVTEIHPDGSFVIKTLFGKELCSPACLSIVIQVMLGYRIEDNSKNGQQHYDKQANLIKTS